MSQEIKIQTGGSLNSFLIKWDNPFKYRILENNPSAKNLKNPQNPTGTNLFQISNPMINNYKFI